MRKTRWTRSWRLHDHWKTSVLLTLDEAQPQTALWLGFIAPETDSQTPSDCSCRVHKLVRPAAAHHELRRLPLSAYEAFHTATPRPRAALKISNSAYKPHGSTPKDGSQTMAFQGKTKRTQQPFPSPEELYLSSTLPRTNTAVDGLWLHQGDVIREYAERHQRTPDLALELPTGSGKTIPGLLIAEPGSTA
ncbi:hypothetical protein [Streptomyces sp. NPDC001508]|uniref:hypothetical protein n=1 Tax=Streptomyces sp. NPDC001508 TaxID=3154656 RepID=UPI003330CE9D